MIEVTSYLPQHFISLYYITAVMQLAILSRSNGMASRFLWNFARASDECRFSASFSDYRIFTTIDGRDFVVAEKF